MKNENYSDFKELTEMFADMSIGDMPPALGHVIDYYVKGDEWHRKHMREYDREEYTELLQILQALRELTEAMKTDDENSVMMEERKIRINMTAWVRFRSFHDLRNLQLCLRTIKSRMVDYLNENTIVDFRQACKTLELWEYGLTKIIND